MFLFSEEKKYIAVFSGIQFISYNRFLKIWFLIAVFYCIRHCLRGFDITL